MVAQACAAPLPYARSISMGLLIGLIALLMLPAEAVSQTAPDRMKTAATWSMKCQQDYLASSQEATKLAVLGIALAQLCECVSVQVTSKMRDDDIRQMSDSAPMTQPIAATYAAARQFCLAMLAR
jgi:hypothetical protein